MHSQPDLEEIVLTAGAGKQVTIEQLSQTLLEILDDPHLHSQYADACRHLSQSMQGATQRTFNHLFKIKPLRFNHPCHKLLFRFQQSIAGWSSG